MSQYDRDYLDEKLDTAVPATPTAGSLNDFLSKAAGGNTFSKATDSLEMLSDKLGGYSGDGGAAQDDSAKASLDLVHTEIDAIEVSKESCTTTGVIVQDGATGDPSVIGVTANASADTFGSWTALDAAAAADCWLCIVTISSITADIAAGNDWCIEIGTGASPAAKIRFSGQTTTAAKLEPLVFTLPIPIKVASGTAISARASTNVGAAVAFAVGLSFYTTLE